MISDEACERMRNATGLLYVLHQMNLDFVAHSDGVGFVPDFFIDVLRQFAIHWRPDDIPPSGAEDVEFLKRDFLLGMNFPHYHRHVERIFPALLEEDRDSLRATADLPSLPDQLLVEDLATARRNHLLQNLRQLPKELLKESTGMSPFVRVSQEEISAVVDCA